MPLLLPRLWSQGRLRRPLQQASRRIPAGRATALDLVRLKRSA
jgi:hypothetical protein